MSFVSPPLTWLPRWLCLFLSGKEIHPSLLHCTTWTRTRWMPTPWPLRLSGRLSRTTTVTRCFLPWDLELNCPQTVESPTSSPWSVNHWVEMLFLFYFYYFTIDHPASYRECKIIYQLRSSTWNLYESILPRMLAHLWFSSFKTALIFYIAN